MLVLSRKAKEQILIGQDIRVTLLRIDGNKVRIGIEAPDEVRVIRGELAGTEKPQPSDDKDDQQGQVSPREEAFAHPRVASKTAPNKTRSNKTKPNKTKPRRAVTNRLPVQDKPQLFVGSVDRDGESPEIKPAPLAGYMTTAS